MSYSYDYLSRLSSSTFHNYSDAGVISGTNNYNENLTYDLRGNIQTLQRTGFYQNGGTCTYGQIDNLSYSYPSSPASNKVHKILDGTTTAGDAKSRGFNGLLSTADNSLTYDANGNLNKNLHKNISSIAYNHLNLPKLITFSTGNTIEFLYDAAGNKLRKTTKTGATVQYVQDYFPGGIEYRQTGTGVKRVESVYHAEGRYYNTNVDASNTIAWRKEYSFRDHLGNTRLAFSDRNANGIVDITGTASTSDILQENHYYPFGLAFEGPWLQNDAGVRDNQYMYNGKELHSDFGLGMYAYGARYYDPSIGRFIGVDPISEKFAHATTYNYAENEPIANIDLWGLQQFYAADGTLLGQIGDNTDARLVNEDDVNTVRKYIRWANTATKDKTRTYNTNKCINLSCDIGMTGEELNVRSTLSTIRESEGHGNALDYDIQYGGNTIENYDDHPREVIKKWGHSSSAAGAYQFLAGTWDAHSTALGLTDFSPASQDKAAIREIGFVRGGMELITSGNYEQALRKLSDKWTSLPGGVHQWKNNVNDIFLKYRANELAGRSIMKSLPGSLLKK